jgi:uncharacterized membrane protein YfcA
MRFRDFVDPEKGPSAMIRLALVPLIFVIACDAVGAFVRQLSGGDLLLLFLALALVSPFAYLIREARRDRTRRHMNRRGAERTPLVPFNRGDV